METVDKILSYALVVFVALLGLILAAVGVWSLMTATSNIPTFRIIGLCPLLIGLMLLCTAPLLKDC